MRTLLFLTTILLVFAFSCAEASARKWTDSTGRHQVEAEFAGLKDGKVFLKYANGEVRAVPLEKLSDADQAFVKSQLAAGRVQSPEQRTTEPVVATDGKGGAALRTKAYVPSKWMEENTYVLRARGSNVDWKTKADIRVSNDLLVTGVPLRYICGCAEHARILAEVRDGLRERETERWAIAKGFSKNWVETRRALIEVSSRRRVSIRELIYHDAILEPLTPAWPSTEWLLNVAELHRGLNRLGPSRHGVAFRALLLRFDPRAAVTEANADEVAEELVWTKALKLSDGTMENLPEVRSQLQAAILEGIGLSIGDPIAPDSAERGAARERLAREMGKLAAVWQDSAKGGLKLEAIPFDADPPLAADKLRTAKRFLELKSLALAKRKLQEIVDQYPDTKAAREARQLLNEVEE